MDPLEIQKFTIQLRDTMNYLIDLPQNQNLPMKQFNKKSILDAYTKIWKTPSSPHLNIVFDQMVKYEIIIHLAPPIDEYILNPLQKAFPGTPRIVKNPDNQIVLCQKKDGNWQLYKIGIAASLGVAGVIAAPALISAAFGALGLSSVGPVAGGIFAGAQGSGLTAGSI